MNKMMPVTWVEPVYFGPFAIPTKVNLDPRVTVITGGNDAGKSALLNAIRLAFTRDTAEESQINQERKDESGKDWTTDTEVVCRYGLPVTELAKEHQLVQGSHIETGDEIECFRMLVHRNDPTAKAVKQNGKQVSRGIGAIKHPQAIMLCEEEIGNPLNLGHLNDAERKLLRLGFGNGFAPETLASQSRPERGNRIARAQDKLNQRLREMLPSSLGLEFRLADTGGSGKELDVSLVDPVQCYVPIGCRGAGVRKLLGLMGTLLSIRDLDRPTLLLMDEPENSLHADAQHMLRRLLENLAESPWIQVVYATHSPSMINTMRPESIRVLQRIQAGDKPTSTIVESPYKDNFLAVRATLGMSPADSLLYAPVVIVVEGDTEVLCLPQILKKLAAGGIEGFEDLDKILPEVCCVNGFGFSFGQVCHLAKLQKAKPLVFLDGDMEGHKHVQSLREAHPDVPVIFIDGKREFEQLVSAPRYVSSLAKELEYGEDRVTIDALASWVNNHPNVKRLAFSKQVERWIEAEFEAGLNKPAVMARAVADSSAKDIDAEPLRILLSEVRRQLSAADH